MRFRFVLAALLPTVLVATSTLLAAEKVLRIGSTPTGVPFTFLDTQGEQYSRDHDRPDLRDREGGGI